jgi:hypothetical protein
LGSEEKEKGRKENKGRGCVEGKSLVDGEEECQ